jgi:hypothetical protein
LSRARAFTAAALREFLFRREAKVRDNPDSNLPSDVPPWLRQGARDAEPSRTTRPERPPLAELDLTDFLKGRAYFEGHFEEIRRVYSGQYVAILNDEVIAHDRDLRRIARWVASRFPDRPIYTPFVGRTSRAKSTQHSRYPIRPTPG